MIPHLFRKTTIKKITNKELLAAINRVKKTSSQKEALMLAYKIIINRYEGHRFRTYLYLWKAFQPNPNILWKRTGFMHCTHQNFLLRVLLVKSGWFNEEDIRLGYSLVWHLSPHQYLKVKVGNKIIAVDPWNNRFGTPLGYFATGFTSHRLDLLE